MKIKILKHFAQPYLYLVLLLIPFLQLGVSYFLSISSILFLGLFFFSTGFKFHAVVLWPPVLAIPGIIIAVSTSPIQPDYLRELRIVVGLCVLLYLLKNIRISLPHRFGLFSFALLATLTVATITQWAFIQNSRFFFLPSNLYVNASDWSLASFWIEDSISKGYELTTVRPSATYSEPSYLGLVMFALLVICLRHSPRRLHWLAIVLSGLTVLTAGTAYGIACVSIASVFYVFNRFSPSLFSRLIFAALFALAAAAIVVSTDRGGSIVSGNDESTITRVSLPIKSVINILEKYPLGIPLTSVAHYLQVTGFISYYDDPPTQNGALNVFFQYGIGALLIFYLLNRIIHDFENKVYLVAIMIQNGASFDFDKILLYCLICGVCIHSKTVLTHPPYQPKQL